MTDEIVVYEAPEAQSIAPLDDELLIHLAEQVDARVNALDRIVHAVARLAGKRGIDNIGGNPYFNAGGCTRIGNALGISWDTPVERKENLEDGHFQFVFDSTFRMGPRTCPATGSRSSKDAFYSKDHGKDVPPSEVDAGNVRKAAFTNLLNNGIKNVLGLKNLSWDDLKDVGLSQESGGQVVYGVSEAPKEKTQERTDLGQALFEMSGDDGEKAQLLLERFSSFLGKDGKQIWGLKSLSDLKDTRVGPTGHKVKEAYKAFQAGGFDVGMFLKCDNAEEVEMFLSGVSVDE